MILDKFLRDLWPKQILRRTDEQILKFWMAKEFTTGPLKKTNHFQQQQQKKRNNKKKINKNCNISSKVMDGHPLKNVYIYS